MTIQCFTHLSGTNQPISVPERTVPILGLQKNPFLPPGPAPKAAPFTAAEALAFTEKLIEELPSSVGHMDTASSNEAAV